MNLYVFIALLLIGASSLACSLIIISAMMSSRATTRLREKYPELFEDEQWHLPDDLADEDCVQKNHAKMTQVTT